MSEQLKLRYAKTTAYAASLVIGAPPTGKCLRVLSLFGYNSGADQFIQIHNSASLPAEGSVPVVVFKAGASLNFSLSQELVGVEPLATGLVICNSSTAPTKTIGSADCWINVCYTYE